MLNGKTALITGGSSGIGLATARRLAADGARVAITGTDADAFDRMMDINVKGVFFTVQSVLPIMSNGGSIILNASWLNRVGTASRSVLSASKAAVRSFARTLSAELVDRRIRVNAVSPGPTETPIHRSPGQTEVEFQAYAEKLGARVPAGRMGRPEEIAAAVAFLASDESAFMLGIEILIDGGLAEL